MITKTAKILIDQAEVSLKACKAVAEVYADMATEAVLSPVFDAREKLTTYARQK